MASIPAFDSLGFAQPERADWVDMQLCRYFMRDTPQSIIGALVASWIMVGMLHNAAPAALLLSWLTLINLTVLFRFLILSRYQRDMFNVSGMQLLAFFKRYDIWWTLTGGMWGVSSCLFLGKATGFEQLICGLLLMGVSCLSVYSYAARLQSFFSFSNALCVTTLVTLTYELLAVQALPLLGDGLALIALTLVFYVMTRYFAIRFHDLQRTSLELQFDNDLLIKKLTAKSDYAMQAVENKNRFIASAAHDLRQPVHALNLYASWLVDEPELAAQVAPQIVRCTQAVNELFDSLFDFSGMNAETTKVHWQEVDLAALFADLQLQYAPLARKSGLQFRLRQRTCWVRTDPVLLKRLLGNLMSNALKNTVRGGVLLALRRPAGRWRIEVWDTGVGIDLAYQQAIFKEFYRVPRSGTQHGFGLGLAISLRLGQLLGYTLRMRSSPGRGSVFWLEQ